MAKGGRNLLKNEILFGKFHQTSKEKTNNAFSFGATISSENQQANLAQQESDLEKVLKYTKILEARKKRNSFKGLMDQTVSDLLVKQLL